MSTSTSTSTSTPRTVQLPSAPVLVGAVYALCVLALDLFFVGVILFTDEDPYASEGPVESIVAISIGGTTALVVGVGLALWLVRSAQRARVGAFLLVALSVISLPFFWAGIPGVLGACAAWSAGLTRGGRPLTGAARVAGVIGAFIALLNVVLTIGGIALSGVVDSAPA
jgi:hypothetical protein